MTNPQFLYLISKNKMVFDESLDKLKLMLQAAATTKHKLSLVMQKQQSVTKRVLEFEKRCNQLLLEIQELQVDES